MSFILSWSDSSLVYQLFMYRTKPIAPTLFYLFDCIPSLLVVIRWLLRTSAAVEERRPPSLTVAVTTTPPSHQGLPSRICCNLSTLPFWISSLPSIALQGHVCPLPSAVQQACTLLAPVQPGIALAPSVLLARSFPFYCYRSFWLLLVALSHCNHVIN